MDMCLCRICIGFSGSQLEYGVFELYSALIGYFKEIQLWVCKYLSYVLVIKYFLFIINYYEANIWVRLGDGYLFQSHLYLFLEPKNRSSDCM